VKDFVQLSKRLRLGIDAREMRFFPGYINLSEVGSLMRFGAKDFEAVNGLPWSVFASFLMGLTWNVWIDMQGPMFPVKLATQLRRGYIIGRKDGLLSGALGVGARDAMAKYFPNPLLSEDELAGFRDRFLELATAQPCSIDLHSMGPSAPIVFSGNTVLVDFYQIPFFLSQTLPRRISDRVKSDRADVAEELVNHRLSGIGLLEGAFAPKKLFKLNRQRLGEADVSYRVGTVLVVIDVKAYAVFDEFGRGEYSAVKTRWGYVQGWLAQADDLAKKLAHNPKGDNYDLAADGYTHILPIVCSSFHEYIDSTEPRYYLTPSIPRVAMPVELERFFERTDETLLRQHRCTVTIGFTEPLER